MEARLDALGRPSRRQLLSWLGAGVVVLTAACSSGGGGGAQPTASSTGTSAASSAGRGKSNGSKLSVWGWQSLTPEGDQALGDLMTRWGSANGTEVEYTVVQNSQFSQKLAAAVEAKATPDIGMFTGAADVQDYAGRDLLVDVSDVWADVSRRAGGFPGYVDPLFRIGSNYFGIPFEADTSPLFARLDLTQQATGSRDLPRSLDDLTTLCQALNNPPGLYALGFTLGRTLDCLTNTINVIWNDGGALVDQDGKVALNSPQTTAAVQRIKGWWDARLIPPDSPTWDDTGNNAAYQSKRVAFVINQPSIYGWMDQHDQGLLSNSTMAPLPAGKSGAYAIAGNWSWSIFKTSKNTAGAKDLIRYLMDPQGLQSVYAKVDGRWYPIYADGQKDPFWTSKPQFAFYPALIASGRDISWPAQPSPALMAALGEMNSRLIIPDMIQDVIVKGTAVEGAVKSAHVAMVEVWKARGAPV
jgi:multiple sugar transport system substrate-binding protein